MQANRTFLQHLQSDASCFRAACCQQQFDNLECRLLVIKLRKKMALKCGVEAFGQLTEYPEFGLALKQRFDCRLLQLQIRVEDGGGQVILLIPRRRGQDHIRPHAGRGHLEIGGEDKFQFTGGCPFLEAVAHVVLIKRISPTSHHGLDAVLGIIGTFPLEKMQIGDPVDLRSLREPPALHIEANPILTGIGGDPGPAFADAAGEDWQKGKCPAFQVAIVPLIVAGAVNDVNGPIFCRIHCYPLYLHRIKTGDGGDLIKRVRGKVFSQRCEDGFHLNSFSVGKRYLELSFKLSVGRIQFFRIEDTKILPTANDKQPAVVGDIPTFGFRGESGDLPCQ